MNQQITSRSPTRSTRRMDGELPEYNYNTIGMRLAKDGGKPPFG